MTSLFHSSLSKYELFNSIPCCFFFAFSHICIFFSLFENRENKLYRLSSPFCPFGLGQDVAPGLFEAFVFSLACVCVCLCVRRVDPVGHVSGLLAAVDVRVSPLDEKFGQQLRTSAERPRERAGRLPELRHGERAHARATLFLFLPTTTR